MSEFNSNGEIGWHKDNDNLITFQLGSGNLMADTPGVIDLNTFKNIQTPIVMNVGRQNVLLKGTNNCLPEELTELIGTNRILPEIIEKQVRILYGKGPRVYKEEIKEGKLTRVWEKQKDIENWLDSWQERGLKDSAKEYCEKVIRDSYYFEDYWIKWRFSKGRRIGAKLPVNGLEHVENKRSRLSTIKNINIYGDDLDDSDFNNIIIGNWRSGIERTYKVYPRLRPSNALKYDVAVSYHKNSMPGQLYGINKFYYGLKHWLTGTNRNPQYINSYLENSLNAKVHVKIPWEWVKSIDKKIEMYCEENKKRQDASKELLKFNAGTDYELEIGTEYHVQLRDKYISIELKRLSKFLTGVKNQGKLYASYKFQTSDGMQEWDIEPIDLKYREFITALIDYDKRADEVITSSKGIDAAISNISKDGVISKSGSDLYYNYIIYLHNLTLAEELCTEALNWAIKLNFPELYANNYRIGFYNEVPARQEEVSPQDRLNNTFNQQIEPVEAQINDLNAKFEFVQSKIEKLSGWQ